MYIIINNLIHSILKAIGFRTINAQFTLSYLLIATFALLSSFLMYSMMNNSVDAVNIAGKQRMLSQRLAKEVLLYSQGLENKKTIYNTIKFFEQAHHLLLDGNETIAPISNKAIISQMHHVEKLWIEYKNSITQYIEKSDKDALKKIKKQSLSVLKNMHQAVTMMAKQSNLQTHRQQIIAFIVPLIIFLLVYLGRAYGLVTLMHNMVMLTESFNKVKKGDFTTLIDIPSYSHGNEIDALFSTYNDT